MSRLTPGLIALDKGLNLQLPKISAPEGSILDSLNYEQVDFQGQRRIDGFARYDGFTVADILEYKVLVVDGFSGAFSPNSGDVLFTDAGLYAVVLATGTHETEDDSVAMHIVEISPLNAPVLNTVDSQAGQTFTELYPGKDEPDVSEQQYYENLVEYNNLLREKVGQLPGPIAGLHWFRDRLYAIASLSAVSLVGTSPIIYPTDTLTFDSDSTEYTVLASYVGSSTRIVFLKEDSGPIGLYDGQPVQRQGEDVGTVSESFELQFLKTDIASLFDSRTVAQAIADDSYVDDDPQFPAYGWRHIPTGWVVHFDNGNSLYGSLTAINQHPADTGASSSTPTAGDSGRPLSLTQKISGTNSSIPANVNGWKTSTFPTMYSLEALALKDVDNYTIYADMFVKWNATTGEVDAPGADGTGLIEYPATNTVEVEV